MLESKRQNNFDAVRLWLAATVMLAHMIVILPADYGVLKLYTDYVDGSRAVQCFFVISGFLIFRSYRASKTGWRYAGRRARRIYPALCATVLACVMLGAVITELPLSQYLSWQTLRYAVFNLAFATFAQPDLPGVFAHNALHIVNGPLWTLKIEVMFYMLVPVMCWVARRFVRFEILAVAVYVASATLSAAAQHFDGLVAQSLRLEQLAHQLPGQLSFFMAGALLEYRLADFRRYASGLVAAAAACLVAYGAFDLYILYPAALAVVVIYLCVQIPVWVPAARYGDFSYGLYIVHFPIIQTFAAFGILAGSPALRAAAVVACCFGAAALSWHAVEKRWLRAPGVGMQAAGYAGVGGAIDLRSPVLRRTAVFGNRGRHRLSLRRGSA